MIVQKTCHFSYPQPAHSPETKWLLSLCPDNNEMIPQRRKTDYLKRYTTTYETVTQSPWQSRRRKKGARSRSPSSRHHSIDADEIQAQLFSLLTRETFLNETKCNKSQITNWTKRWMRVERDKSVWARVGLLNPHRPVTGCIIKTRCYRGDLSIVSMCLGGSRKRNEEKKGWGTGFSTDWECISFAIFSFLSSVVGRFDFSSFTYYNKLSLFDWFCAVI